MKCLPILLFFLFALSVCGQSVDQAAKWEKEILAQKGLSNKEYKADILKYDFAPLFVYTDNSSVFGFIGDNYQRIRIKIISAKKDITNPDKYAIYGKSMRSDNVIEFNGTITITKARVYTQMHWGMDDEYKEKGIKKQGIIIAAYKLQEDPKEADNGTFEGLLLTSWYIDRNDELKYDDIEYESDSYSNNQFVGIWRSNDDSIKLTCNWGDHRIPLSGDLDGGAGEFSPIDKFLQYGWQTYRDAYINNNEFARQEEKRKWW